VSSPSKPTPLSIIKQAFALYANQVNSKQLTVHLLSQVKNESTEKRLLLERSCYSVVEDLITQSQQEDQIFVLLDVRGDALLVEWGSSNYNFEPRQLSREAANSGSLQLARKHEGLVVWELSIAC